MSVASVRLYRYRLPLAAPLRVQSAELHVREGLILRVESAAGAVGLGDIAPLPGASVESFADAKAAAARWTRLLLRAPIPLKPVDLAGGPEAWAAVPRSVQFGVSTAAAMLKAGGRPEPGRIFAPDHRPAVALNALIAAHGAEAAEQAREAVTGGYRTVKLKVGRRPVEEDIDSVRQVRAAVGDRAAIRLDANRAWDFQTAEFAAAALRGLDIEYIEEPLDYWKLLFSFRLYTHVDYAIDETLQEFRDELIPIEDQGVGPAPRGRLAPEQRQHLRQAAKRARAHILKPTLLGGMRAIRAIVDGCSRPWSATPVISSAFESGLGLILLANLAAVIDESGAPIGLDTYKWLADDVLPAPLPIRDGRLDLAEANALLPEIDFSRLELVAIE